MPISKQNKKLYPANWKQISQDIRTNRAHNKCEVCGVLNHAYIFRCMYDGRECYQTVNGDLYDANNSELIDTETYDYSLDATHTDRAIKIILTVAHLDHNPQNNDYNNLRAMCQRCHNRYDATHRKESRKANKTKDIYKLNF